MNQYKMLQDAYAQARRNSTDHRAKQWLKLNKSASDDYQHIRRSLRPELQQTLPSSSGELLEKIPPEDIVHELTLVFEQLLKQKSAKGKYIQSYLSHMQQLLQVSYEMVKDSALSSSSPTLVAGAHNAHTESDVRPKANPVDAGAGRVDERSAASAARGAGSRVAYAGIRSPGVVPSPPPYSGASGDLLVSLTQQSESIINTLQQAVAAATRAHSGTLALRQGMDQLPDQIVGKQHYDKVYDELYILRTEEHKRSRDLARQLISVICDLEAQYGPDSAPVQADEPAADARFAEATRSVIRQLEGVLKRTFDVTRIPITRGHQFDADLMQVDTHEIESPDAALSGTIAYVLVPGYWRAYPDGTVEIYQYARVRRFMPGRRQK